MSRPHRTFTTYPRQAPRRACQPPPIGIPRGVDPGDIWHCNCGRYWLAYTVRGSIYRIHWRPISRLRGWAATLGRVGAVEDKNGPDPGTQVPTQRRPT